MFRSLNVLSKARLLLECKCERTMGFRIVLFRIVVTNHPELPNGCSITSFRKTVRSFVKFTYLIHAYKIQIKSTGANMYKLSPLKVPATQTAPCCSARAESTKSWVKPEVCNYFPV